MKKVHGIPDGDGYGDSEHEWDLDKADKEVEDISEHFKDLS